MRPIFSGGPLEIIQRGISGYHIDPNAPLESAECMAEFFEQCVAEPGRWTTVSEAALHRVAERYTWKHYAERLMTPARVCGFWRNETHLDRDEARRHLEMFYALQYRPLAAELERS